MINKLRISNIKDNYLNLSIAKKIVIYFSIIFVVSIITITIVYEKVNTKYTLEKLEKSSLEVLESAKSNINIIVGNVNNVSKMIISSENIQNILNNKEERNNSLKNNINDYLIQFTNFQSNISSIYILDYEGNKYYSENYLYKKLNLNDVKKAKWYEELLEKNGEYILKYNGGGLIEDEDRNYVSFIRLINDINTQKTIGVMVINIDEDVFFDFGTKLEDKYSTRILIRDNENNFITKASNIDILDNLENEINYCIENGTINKEINKKNYILSSILVEGINWDIVSISAYSKLLDQNEYVKYIILYFILVNFILIVIGAMVISKIITGPINKLCESMNEVVDGKFNIVNIKTYDDEIGQMKNRYNSLIVEIQNLMEKIKENEEKKREIELDLLMSQIKPHFLYNTLDSINSLALSGENKRIYKMIKSLGKFYRVSLNKGSNIITIKEEIDTIKNYLIIQEMRYSGTLDVEYNLDNSCNEYKIIKLVLQPLVENSIYHGIRNKEGKGKIIISTYQNEESVFLSVEDNGLGINKEKIQGIYNNEGIGVGLRATKERLRIFYGDKFRFLIESELNIGTKIIIQIPKEKLI
ncbi:histidine kinase [Clostridium sp. AL.422]|uniref:sensor histidine kinase n=1 Tax=Clostridium TaxID=1485 RepID=UPI00293DF7E2|nr:MULTISPECIES: histidine kinase [unclassified Clostridium]MDV4149328.1 histidine kinase [Clostridium sp. AL.422]